VDAICLLLNLYLIVIFVRILMSWFPITPGSAMESVHVALYAVTEPVLGPVRRVVPPVRLGVAAIDLSAIIVLIGGQILVRSIGCG
jgi:YggT family protein